MHHSKLKWLHHGAMHRGTQLFKKIMRRRYERKYNKSQLKDRQTYFKQCKSIHKMLNGSKRKHISSKIKQHEIYFFLSKALFRITKKMMGHSGDTILTFFSQRTFSTF